MPARPLSRAEVRALDARAADELGLPTLLLMENAGRGAAALLRDQLRPGDEVAILCGPGNNGGDGGVVARHLDGWGFGVRVAWLDKPGGLVGDPSTQYRILDRSNIRQSVWDEPTRAEIDAFLGDAAWVVDGLLGTGADRPVEGRLRGIIEAINARGRPVLALDLPSGLDADSGEPLGIAVRASMTATFVAPKLGFDRPGARAYTGAVHVVDIGLPGCLLR